ncbi:MAG TPA: nitroreductase [Methylomusa anaerophila]|uniref:Nitroreductase n=1 Tax=Methylomusa anaerophila TaxID=1930071 RepID=A0A348AEJ3_9FIRM|nr:nitroreductase [Methylomusa anaerophila]BBB89491.1 hypothetical protein MAMMFC1_00124 [Methylomusa anaerophila]HML89722.1 nitroreductase [Methylomusa anaerophila]
MTQEVSPVVCKNCASRLAKWCYERHWWFRLIREPLLFGMRSLAWWHRIDARKHKVRNPECHGCIRFMKAELEEKSATFRFLDEHIGKKVSNLRNSLLTQQELDEAKRYAREEFGKKREE